MKKYKLTAHVTVSAYCEVTANSEKEALKIAEGFEAAIGGMGTGNEPDSCWIIEEADGMATNIRVESVE